METVNPYSLYTYCRSSASYRVRIALNLKNIPYNSKFINLTKNGGEENSAAYQLINPQKLVPSFTDGDHILTQSIAIIEYIDEIHPALPLLPPKAIDRAFVRSLALNISCDIQPINNLRVLKYLESKLNIENEARDSWYQHWINEGFSAYEKSLEYRYSETNQKVTYSFGDQPTLADICLIPQVYNAQRFNCDLTQFPTIISIYKNCMKLAAFIQASPEEQGDFPVP